MELSLKLSNLLKGKKNLLAFSAGVDSSALFFLLLEHNISFDIALVNYGLRQQAKDEEAYALELSKKYNLKAHIAHAPKFENNFEKNARDFRYTFFDKLMSNYDNLLTAHQLNDQLEWFLMRLTKGAGVHELMGLEEISVRKEYKVIRPLLQQSKEELLNYLKSNNYHYFVDQSNFEPCYERNIFRERFANELLEGYCEGIKRSFNYLKEDKEALNSGVKMLFHQKELFVIAYKYPYQIPRVVDQYLKKLGYLLSASQREELKSETSIVFGGVWAVEVTEDKIFIAPYSTEAMPKKFKERCRVAKIPSKIRPYIFREGIEVVRL